MNTYPSLAVRIFLLGLLLVGIMMAPKCTVDDRLDEEKSADPSHSESMVPKVASPPPTIRIPPTRRKPRLTDEDVADIRTEISSNVWLMCEEHFPDAEWCQIDKVEVSLQRNGTVKAYIEMDYMPFEEGWKKPRRKTIVRYLERMGPVWTLVPPT